MIRDLVQRLVEAVKPKWERDGIDTYETWWLGDESDPDATVAPGYSMTRRISGNAKPDYWTVVVRGKKIGEFPSVKQAKAAAEEALRGS